VTGFEAARAELLAARAAQAKARQARRQALEAQRALAAAMKRLHARIDPEQPDQDALAERAALEREARTAAAEVEATREAEQEAMKTATAALPGFVEFSDPRRTIGRLPDRSPLALLPVRIETRFATVSSREAPRHQLRVRIYPDDCSIDTFEPTLSTTEVANVKRYWQRRPDIDVQEYACADNSRRDAAGLYEERLSLDPASVDLAHFIGAPVLDGHRQDSVDRILGVVTAAHVDGQRGHATIEARQPEIGRTGTWIENSAPPKSGCLGFPICPV
jgi:hypothetical protein